MITAGQQPKPELRLVGYCRNCKNVAFGSMIQEKFLCNQCSYKESPPKTPPPSVPSEFDFTFTTTGTNATSQSWSFGTSANW